MSVLFISGDQVFLRERSIKNLIRERLNQGYVVEYSDGSDLRGMLSGVLFTGPTLSVIVDSKELDAEVVSEFVDTEGHDLCIVWRGKPKATSNFAKVSNKYKDVHHIFNEVSPWKQNEQAENFIMYEAKRYGKLLSSNIARVLVHLIGCDLGVLSFEVLKICTLCDVDGSDEVKKEHVKGAIARVTEASLMPFSNAVGKRSLKEVLRQADRIEGSHIGDPTMRVCGFLTPQVLKWVVGSSLRDRGMTAKDMAELMGENPWYFKNQVLPSIVSWGYQNSKKLLSCISVSERSVKQGVISPWTSFLCRLLELCK